MGKIEYHLYRAKFIKSRQTSMLHDDLTPSQVFAMAIQERPSIMLRKDHIWHIGNVENFDENSGYFAIGRTTKTTIEKFDQESGNFIEESYETSPYTHVVFNSRIGFIGIAQKSKLSPTTKGIAQNIEKLLQQTEIVRRNEINVRIDLIPDPQNFLEMLLSAFVIKKFIAHFTGPNPNDADEYFQKPLSVYCDAIGASYGKVEAVGDNLNKENVVEVSKSTASTGNSASATIQRHQGDGQIRIHLGDNPVKRVYEDESHNKKSVHDDFFVEYERVRNG